MKEKAFVLCKWATLLWRVVQAQKAGISKRDWGCTRHDINVMGCWGAGRDHRVGGLGEHGEYVLTMLLASWKRQNPKIKGWRDGVLGNLGNRYTFYWVPTMCQALFWDLDVFREKRVMERKLRIQHHGNLDFNFSSINSLPVWSWMVYLGRLICKMCVSFCPFMFINSLLCDSDTMLGTGHPRVKKTDMVPALPEAYWVREETDKLLE